MTCTEFEELSGAYVLDALTPEEQKEADAHLATCTRCTHLVQELRTVVDLLPLSVPRVEPSADVKERILSAIERESPQVRKAQQPQPLSSLPRRRRTAIRSWGSQLLVAAAVLFFLLFAGMTAWNLNLQQQVTHLAANAPVTYGVQGTDIGSNVTGQLTYFPQQHVTVLVMRNLPSTEGTHVYQGWVLKGKQPTSIGLLNIQNGVATVDIASNVQGFDAVAVSLEPGPLATQAAPVGPVVAVGSLHAASASINTVHYSIEE